MFDIQIIKKKLEQISQNAVPGFSAYYISEVGVFSHSFGIYGKDKQIKVGEDTKYDIASITKLYTAALIIKAYENNYLNIYDHCSKYLSNFNKSSITILDLLTHRASFGIRLSELRERYGGNFKEEILNINIPKMPQDQIEYENVTYIFLGMILERLYNKPLSSIFTDLFKNLGLSNTITGADITMPTPPTEIINGKEISGITHDESARLCGGLAGNAGIFATAKDLAIFGLSWLNGRICNLELLNDVVFNNYDKSGQKPQGVGWWMRIPGLEEVMNINGMFVHTGFTGCILAVKPDNHSVYALTCNRTFYGRDNKQHLLMWQYFLTAFD